ncbi:MAG: DUF4332 domain-containing protein [Staphylococcus sp.]|nr:DUF4332 domain-containing protein [Staphylococcus sp.]
MRPEKTQRRDKEEAFTAIGVPAEWVAPIYKAGVNTLEQLAGQTAGKLHQELCGINKKFKLGFKAPLLEEVGRWIAAAAPEAAAE